MLGSVGQQIAEGSRSPAEGTGWCVASHREHSRASELERDMVEACSGMVSQEIGGRVAWNMKN